MKQACELIETGVMQSFKVEKKTTVRDLMKELALEECQLMSVLVNGKKQDLDFEIDTKDEVVIIPAIRGGYEISIFK